MERTTTVEAVKNGIDLRGLHTARASSLLEEAVAELAAANGAGWWDGDLSPRVERLLDGLNRRTHAQHRTVGSFTLPAEHLKEPAVVRRALAFALVLREMPIYIQDGEVLVGGRTVYGPPREKGSEVFPGLSGASGIGYFPTYTTPQEAAAAGLRGGAASNHNAIGYGRVLTLGLRGLRELAARSRAEIAVGGELTPEDRERRLAFLRAVDVCLEALTRLIRRYTALARQLAAEAPSPERAAELSAIAGVCERVAEAPPATFREALQLFLFARVASMVESYACMPLGRFDQYLWPFLQEDLSVGRIDRHTARELLECLFVKLNEEIDLSSTDDCQRIMLSGQTCDGEDATNELSYLCLEAAVRLRLPSPKVGVRLHRGTPAAFFRRVVETVKLGIAGLPEIYNDESVIPGLLRFGIPLHDARDYCHDGCSEITIGGKSDFYPTWTGVRHLRVLSETLAEAPDEVTFEDLLMHYKTRLCQVIATAAERGNARDRALAAISPAPFMSATLEGCLERGLDKTWGGTLYNMTGMLGSELVNAANALAAIRQIVFEERAISLPALKAALDGNFAGIEGERLRLRLRNRCPKFGNDDERVDALAAEIAALFITEAQSYANPRGGRYCPGFFDFAGYVTAVRTLGATPDGRRAGESVSGHLAPTGGTDRNGVTATFHSMSRVTRLHPPMGTMFDVKLHPSAVRGETGTEKLAALIRTFMEMDGKALQFNVVDAATLRAAQREPEKYRDLLVRVWGFSAYFVELSADFQEHIINRTEHGL
ncbi:MAG: formate C-acetyltransferase [Chloroflexi bacterium]|nr:formate C-acetyltransferase [Chloroflexota bacterium]